MELSIYAIITWLLVGTALCSYINFRFIGLPPVIGVMFLALLLSLGLLLGSHLSAGFFDFLLGLIRAIDFHTVLMKILLSFLLFAGALHVDTSRLRDEGVPVLALSTLGVFISTFLVGGAMFYVFSWFHTPMPFILCLLFGALISPTDPIAVLGILKAARISERLEIKITGESLFNDGVGVVVFVTILEVATTGTAQITGLQVLWLLIKDAGGGLAWGALLGYAGVVLLRSIDNYRVEVLLSLALVMGGYMLADWMHISGPLAMVVAGLVIGSKGNQMALSPLSRDYLEKFWELVDEMLNAVLFLLLGLEMLVIPLDLPLLGIGILGIGVVLFARWISVLIPVSLISLGRSFGKHTTLMLTWGGLRGGISVALALSLPVSMHQPQWVAITYIIVVFSILVQGLTIGKLAAKLGVTGKPLKDG